ncbi:MAG: 2-iminoacetate synthase ThiH [Bacteroidetes bacterium]|nr:2-iminoacetate synthase ThiH [Bacteroidota bacterium]
MNTFNNIIKTYDWKEVQQSILSKTAKHVEQALANPKHNLEDFKALISPAAAPYIEKMAQISQMITQKRFGKIIQLYNPLYLSNECSNCCKYCGFNAANRIKRITLNNEQILKEAAVLKSWGFDHVLLVTGESSAKAGFDYLKNALKLVKPMFSHISMEVQPLKKNEYEELVSLGLNTVYIYQETYCKESYNEYHPSGVKADYNWRLETPDRLGSAGIFKTGLGILIGLEDWRADSFFTALHLDYLEKTYWQTRYSVSFPRLRPAKGIIEPKVQMSDKELVQLICAYRIFNEEVELSISTRENPKFRDNIIKLGITAMSAGSRTNPGGYSTTDDSLEQFVIADERATGEIVEIIKKQGYEPVWKDWDRTLQ